VINLYEKRLNEMSIQDFFFEQNPVEKYRLECVKTNFKEIFSSPGKYHCKDICLSGCISSISDDYIFIVEDENMIRYEYDAKERVMFDSIRRLESEFGISDNRILQVNEIEKEKLLHLNVGDRVLVYGELYDKEYQEKIDGTVKERQRKKISNPQIIEVEPTE